jgi:hypothetical protein
MPAQRWIAPDLGGMVVGRCEATEAIFVWWDVGSIAEKAPTQLVWRSGCRGCNVVLRDLAGLTPRASDAVWERLHREVEALWIESVRVAEDVGGAALG